MSRVSSVAATLLAIVIAVLVLRAQSPDINGTWSGTASDFWVNHNSTDGMRVTLQLAVSGSTVSGTVTSTTLTVVQDGTCSGCHRVKGGTVSGTLSDSSLALTLAFPGNTGEITPTCHAEFSGTSTDLTPSHMTLAYSGSDSCEGPFQNGVLEMAPGPPSAPSIVSQPLAQAVASGSSASLGVVTPGTPPILYQWYRGDSGDSDHPVSGATARTLVTPPVTGPVRYWVRVANFYGFVNSTAADLDVTQGFSDEVMVAGATGIRAAHIMELRSRINQLRARYGLAPYPFTDASVEAFVTEVRAAHVQELRAALVEAYGAAGRAAPVFTHAALQGELIRAIHIKELRNAIVALE